MTKLSSIRNSDRTQSQLVAYDRRSRLVRVLTGSEDQALMLQEQAVRLSPRRSGNRQLVHSIPRTEQSGGWKRHAWLIPRIRTSRSTWRAPTQLTARFDAQQRNSPKPANSVLTGVIRALLGLLRAAGIASPWYWELLKISARFEATISRASARPECQSNGRPLLVQRASAQKLIQTGGRIAAYCLC